MNFDQAYSISQQIKRSKLTQQKNELYRVAIR